jgi:hypothetical protein
MYILYGEDDINAFDIFVGTIHSIDTKIVCVHAIHGDEVLQMLADATIVPNASF